MKASGAVGGGLRPLRDASRSCTPAYPVPVVKGELPGRCLPCLHAKSPSGVAEAKISGSLLTQIRNIRLVWSAKGEGQAVGSGDFLPPLLDPESIPWPPGTAELSLPYCC